LLPNLLVILFFSELLIAETPFFGTIQNLM
jgi:hypothetical protein